MLELALEITLGIVMGAGICTICWKLLYGDKIFELYQRFTWLQKDIHSLATKEETEK